MATLDKIANLESPELQQQYIVATAIVYEFSRIANINGAEFNNTQHAINSYLNPMFKVIQSVDIDELPNTTKELAEWAFNQRSTDFYV